MERLLAFLKGLFRSSSELCPICRKAGEHEECLAYWAIR